MEQTSSLNPTKRLAEVLREVKLRDFLIDEKMILELENSLYKKDR